MTLLNYRYSAGGILITCSFPFIFYLFLVLFKLLNLISKNV